MILITIALSSIHLWAPQVEEPPTPPANTTKEAEDSIAVSTILEQYLLDHDSQTVIARLEECVQERPMSAISRLALARMLVALGDSERALRQLDAIQEGNFDVASTDAAKQIRESLAGVRVVSELAQPQATLRPTPEPTRDELAERAEALLRAARSASTEQHGLLLDEFTRDAKRIGEALSAQTKINRSEYDERMDEAYGHLRVGATDRAQVAFLAAQAMNYDSLEPITQLFLIACRARSVELALRFAPLAKGRAKACFEQLFQYPESSWLFRERQFIERLSITSIPQESDFIQDTYRVATIQLLLQDCTTLTKSTLTKKIAESTRHESLRNYLTTLPDQPR